MRPFPLLALLAMCTLSLLTGCKDPSSSGAQPNAGLVAGGPDVVVRSVGVYAPSGNSVQGNEIYVVKFTFTNHLGTDFIPQTNKFIFQDITAVRHAGIDSGSAMLAGISNDTSVLKRGDSRDYTVGFLVYQGTTGQLYYDPS